MMAHNITFMIFIIILIIVITYPSKKEKFQQQTPNLNKYYNNTINLRKDLLKGTHDIAKYFIINN